MGTRARTIGIIALSSLLWSVLSPAQALGAARVALSSFERGFEGWTPDHFIECETDDSCATPFEWSITRSQDQAFHRSVSLKAFLNGLNDDGTIWVERRFSVPPGSRVRAHLSFWLWSETQSDFNTWPVVAYVGTADPETEEDFAIVGQTDQKAGWKRYSQGSVLTAGPSGDVWVAFGIGATWESPRTHYLDFAVLRLTALSQR
jgi:hypothetical protein